MTKLRTLLVLGTRPEAIKMAPVIRSCLDWADRIETLVCLTGQHREMLRQAFGREGTVSSLRVKLESPSKFEAFRANVEGDKRLGLGVQRETEFYERQSEGTSTFIAGLGILVSVFFSVGAMIGRSDTLMRGRRPKAAAFSWMSAMRCLTAASGSPQRAYTSQCLAATVAAAPEAPPK